VPTGVHLVGSVPLADAEEVFRLSSEVLGRHLRRLPDGETGNRLFWNSWTRGLYERTPGLELVDPAEGNYTPWRQARLLVDPSELEFGPIGYADAARESWAFFSRLKEDGLIPGHVRFQVSIPSPIAPMIVLVEEGSRAAVEGPFRRRLYQEVQEIVDAVPHDELAIQWDVCQDVGIWEGYYPSYFDDKEAGVIARLAEHADAIPEGVEVGFHLCYGDFKHRHFMQPNDGGVLAEMSNRLAEAVSRRLDWIHVPVPIDRTDDGYFEPFRELALGRETEFDFGLIHFTDGEEGTRRRVETASKVRDEFGVGTECGFGRRPPETVRPLMELHAEVAAPVV
jgi:hypothetical protein